MQFANRKSKIVMKQHNGMRPQDIVILMKIVSLKGKHWMNIDLSRSLNLSASEISESLYRSKIAGLIDSQSKEVFKQALLEFLLYGIKYVYPQKPGALVRGMPTAHSAKPLSEIISSDEPYVWPDPDGVLRGQAIEPLYPGVVEASKKDQKLYELLSLTDAIRVGRAREHLIAVKELEKRIMSS